MVVLVFGGPTDVNRQLGEQEDHGNGAKKTHYVWSKLLIRPLCKNFQDLLLSQLFGTQILVNKTMGEEKWSCMRCICSGRIMASVLSSFAGSVASETSERPKGWIVCPDFGDGDDIVYIINISTYLFLHVHMHNMYIIYILYIMLYVYSLYRHLPYTCESQKSFLLNHLGSGGMGFGNLHHFF